MRSQFLRIYLLMIAIVCILLYSFNAIFQQITDDDKQHFTSINQLFELQQHNQSIPRFKEISIVSVTLPTKLKSRLDKGEIISLEVNPNYWSYYQKRGDKLLVFGPVPDFIVDDSIGNYFFMLFYSALALLFLVLLKPLFSELNQLQQAAKTFGKKPQPIKFNINHRSSIYPLALSFQKMSRQIVNLLTMNRDLSRTIAHELRTPLARMRFVIEALTDQIEPFYQKRLEQDIDEIDQLIAAYLTFSKLDSDSDIFQTRSRKIEPLLLKLKGKYKLYSDKLTFNFNYQKIVCTFDANHLAIAIQNLISNAMRYANSTIKVDFKMSENNCILTVSDDGPGMPADKLNLFDAFIRKQSKQSDKGFGLGLYIARRVAILHSGELSVGNDPELGGARFTLTWPNTINN